MPENKKKSLYDTLRNGKIDKKMPAILLATLLLGSVLGSWLVHVSAKEAAQQRFMRVSEGVASTIRGRLNYYLSAVRQTAAMFMANEEVTQQEFRIYADNMSLQTDYPGMSALGFASFSQGERLDARVLRFRHFQNHLIDLEGLNLMRSPSIQSGLLKSGAEGLPKIGDASALFDSAKTKTPMGFVIVYPVYKSEKVPRQEAERLNNLKGFVFAVFNNQHLFNMILSRHDYFQKSLGIDVYFEGAAGTVGAFSSSSIYGPKRHSPVFQNSLKIRFAGSIWIFNIKTNPSVEPAYSPKIGYIVFFLSAFLSFIVFWAAKRFSREKTKAEESEEKMRKAANENSLLAHAGEVLGKSLSTQASLNQMAEVFASNFADFSVMEFSDEEKQQQIVRASNAFIAREPGSKNRMSALAGEFTVKEGCRNKVREREGVVIASRIESENFKSYIAIPLMIRGSLFGVLTLLKCEEDGVFFESKSEFIERLARISMIFVENTLLFEEAELANRLKDEFLATVSHELRTPLNVIYGHAQLLLESDLEPDYRDQILSIYKAAQAQSGIIEDLLDVSAIISGKVQFNPRPVKVMSAVDTALESVKLEAKRKGVELIFEEPHQCIVMGVKTRLVQIFWNLLSNAIKFTPEGGKVAVKTEIEGQNCVVKVIDTGRGIEPEFLPHIFEKFRQEEKVSTRAKGGLGLGLSIVSHLVNLHGGTIKAESEGRGKGAIFTVSFPIVSLTARKGPKEEKERIQEIERHDLHDVSILAVDDEPESLNLIARILRSYKANVITAANGAEALKKIKSERPDILISDIAMPEMDGYQLIKEIRQKERGQGTHIPAIALTAFAQEEDKQRAMSSGYEAYLSKPVNKDKLIVTVEQALH